MNRHKHPEMYMKRLYNKMYFEGWYYKQVDSTMNHTISFIPSVSFSKESSLAYLQVIYQKGDQLITDVCTYDINEFAISYDKFLVNIASSSFSDNRIDIDFKGRELTIEGIITFLDLSRLQYSLLNPNIMGIFSYMPLMQCNHGILSMNHLLRGSLTINGERISFNGGKGYIEKDWGSSFPKEYIWIQCNHFKNDSTSLFFSYATIPFLFSDFNGFICNLLLNNRQYRFATYTRSKINIKTKTNKVRIFIENNKYKLIIIANSKGSIELYAPKSGKMSNKINESLKGDVEIVLYDKKENELLYSDMSNHLSMEIVK